MNKSSSKKFIAGNVGLIVLTSLALIILVATSIFITRPAINKEVLEAPASHEISFDPSDDGNIELVNNDNDKLSGISKSPKISFESYLDKDFSTHVSITTDQKKFSATYNKDGSPASMRGVWLTGGVAPFDQADKESLKKLVDSFSSKLIFCSNSAVNIKFSEFLIRLAGGKLAGWWIHDEATPVDEPIDKDWPVVKKEVPTHPMGILEEVLETSRPLVFNGDCNIGLVNNDDRFFGISKSLKISFESYLDKDLVTHVEITTDQKKFSGEFTKSGSISRPSIKGVYLTGGSALVDLADLESFAKLSASLKPLYRANSAVTINFGTFFSLLMHGGTDINDRAAIIQYYQSKTTQDTSKTTQDTSRSLSTAELDIAHKKSRDARRISDVKQLGLALEMYSEANQDTYPAALASLVPTFIPMIPTDPLTASAYKYCLSSATNFMGYHLGATMEDASNAALSSDADWVDDGCVSGSFNGNAAACTGTTAADPDLCYDVRSAITNSLPSNW